MSVYEIKPVSIASLTNEQKFLLAILDHKPELLKTEAGELAFGFDSLKGGFKSMRGATPFANQLLVNGQPVDSAAVNAGFAQDGHMLASIFETLPQEFKRFKTLSEYEIVKDAGVTGNADMDIANAVLKVAGVKEIKDTNGAVVGVEGDAVLTASDLAPATPPDNRPIQGAKLDMATSKVLQSMTADPMMNPPKFAALLAEAGVITEDHMKWLSKPALGKDGKPITIKEEQPVLDKDNKPVMKDGKVTTKTVDRPALQAETVSVLSANAGAKDPKDPFWFVDGVIDGLKWNVIDPASKQDALKAAVHKQAQELEASGKPFTFVELHNALMGNLRELDKAVSKTDNAKKSDLEVLLATGAVKGTIPAQPGTPGPADLPPLSVSKSKTLQEMVATIGAKYPNAQAMLEAGKLTPLRLKNILLETGVVPNDPKIKWLADPNAPISPEEMKTIFETSVTLKELVPGTKVDAPQDVQAKIAEIQGHYTKAMPFGAFAELLGRDFSEWRYGVMKQPVPFAPTSDIENMLNIQAVIDDSAQAQQQGQQPAVKPTATSALAGLIPAILQRIMKPKTNTNTAQNLGYIDPRFQQGNPMFNPMASRGLIDPRFQQGNPMFNPLSMRRNA